MDKNAGRVFHGATLDDLAQIRQYVGEVAATTSSELGEFIVAVNEAVANIIRHSYQDSPGDIQVIVTRTVDSIKVTLLDNGPKFDPTHVASPDVTLPLEERPFGGMGVHIMKEFCDELSYHRNEQDENELTLLKYVKHPTRLDES